jgi:putative glutamine amidotransferase
MTRHPAPHTVGRPVVAVTATVRGDDGVRRVRLTAAYLDALERAGVVPLVLAPSADDEGAPDVGRVLDVVDGLVLTGGEDVDPVRYGAVQGPSVSRVSAARDAMEIAAVHAARDRRIPTLAICRGIQVLNVALGGTLIQDIPSERPGALGHDPDAARDQRTHVVHLVAGSRAARAVEATTLNVNSVHHQAIDRVANGLAVTGTAPDGIIESVETPDEDPWWVLAVQWHPEEFVRDSAAPDHGLFAAFAAALEPRLVTVL